MPDYRICYDSTDPNAIPSSAQLVLQYLDGANQPVVAAWRQAAVGRFANARKVGIVVLASTNDGLVLDVERGDATPQQAPGWVQMRRAAGVDPTVYCSLSDWPTVRQCFQAAHVPEPHYFIAAYDNYPAIPAGAIAKQYANAPFTGGNFDISSVADFWPGVDDKGDTPLLDLNQPADKQLFQMVEDIHGTVGPILTAVNAAKADLDTLAAHPGVVSDPQLLTLVQQIRSHFS